MKLTHEDHDQLSVLSVRGDLTGDQVDAFRKLVIERIGNQIRDFVLDCDGLEFIDSRGLETLLWLQDEVTERLGQVRLACLQEDVKQILAMTRLASRFDCREDVSGAIDSLR